MLKTSQYSRHEHARLQSWKFNSNVFGDTADITTAALCTCVFCCFFLFDSVIKWHEASDEFGYLFGNDRGYHRIHIVIYVHTQTMVGFGF